MTDTPGIEPDQPTLPEGEEAAPPGVRTMAMLRWTLVGLMALAATAAVLYYLDLLPGGGAGASDSATVYYCPMHPGIQQDRPGECPICGMTLVPRERSGTAAKSGAPKPEEAGAHAGHRHDPADPYQCPMHPEETGADTNARCPICAMRLSPRTKGAPPPSPVPGLVPLTLGPDRVQLIGMRREKVTREALLPELRTVGFVTASEKKVGRIQTRFSGWIEKLMVDETGQRVTRGQVLATLYSPELIAAQQEYVTATRWSTEGQKPSGHVQALTGTLVKDARRRLDLLGIAREEIEELERTGQPASAIPIRSPVSGYVTQKSAVQGLYVQPGTLLFEVADLSTVWVLADVYEHEIARVREGQSARLVLASYPDQTFSGRVQFLYPMVDASTRTLKVRLEFKNPRMRMRPGMYGDVVLSLDHADGLVVPREAVVDTGEHQYVFVDRGHGRFEPRAIRLGMRAGEKVQVSAGLVEGELVVTTGNFLIDSESRLAATIQGSGK